MHFNPIIMIPVRLGSTRLPQKPLADIHGKPMVQHVWERAITANIAPVVVATDHAPIAELIQSLGGSAVMTDPNLPSGSDRIHAALQVYDPQGQYNVVVNLQGDLPNISSSTLQAVIEPLAVSTVDVATLAAVITDEAEITNPNVPKIALSFQSESLARALYFSRSPIPAGSGLYYHHIGIYAYRRAMLDKFVSLPPSPLELQERLEQLRLLEAGAIFGVKVVDTIPISVDIEDDLQRVRRLFAAA